MTQRTLVLHPDPILRSRCGAIGSVSEPVRKLAEEMLVVMYAAQGRGLAGPQVGEAHRIFVMDSGWKDGAAAPVVCIDPEITWESEDLVAMEERCLSLPDQPRSVRRPDAIELSWTDLDGERITRRLDAAEARIAQHEIDHLDGRLILDHPVAQAG